MSVAGFLVRRRDDLGGVDEIIPTVDGIDLLNLIHTFEKRIGMETRDASYGGLIPSFYRFGPMGQHFSARDQSKPLLGCDCGEWGCWPLLAAIREQGDAVTWSEFQQHRSAPTGTTAL